MCEIIDKYKKYGKVLPEQIKRKQSDMCSIEVHDMDVSDIAMLMALDEKIFPAEMLMTQEEYEHLASIPGGIVAKAFDGKEIIGAAFGFPAEAVKADLKDSDSDFEPCAGEFYSYSVGILPSFQKSGLGQKLALAFAEEAKHRGWQFLSAHVRMPQRMGRSKKIASGTHTYACDQG